MIVTRDNVAALALALDQYIADLCAQAEKAAAELTQVNLLRYRAAKALEVAAHLRDEDVTTEVVRLGDHLRVSTAILQAWIDAGAATTTVVVANILVEPDGTKTVIVTPSPRAA